MLYHQYSGFDYTDTELEGVMSDIAVVLFNTVSFMSNIVDMYSQTYWVLCYRYSGCDVTGIGEVTS